MYQFYIANKNYSSWSLRPWMVMRELEHEEEAKRTGIWLADLRASIA